ncbi:hypothetical protein [Nannocystis pusilla]|uniref:hypothetical protein n=1 Tax=Nannocystis pusilla TaxID=889268 RepID=UPI003B7914A1
MRARPPGRASRHHPAVQDPDPLNSYSLSANLSVPISDYILSLAPARKGTLAARESAVFARDAERVKVQTDARLAYYNWLRGVASWS